MKNDGKIIAAFLSPYSHAISLLKRNPENILKLKEEFKYIIENRENRNPEKLNFTYAWYPNPNQIKEYMDSKGFKAIKIANVESLG